MTDRDRWGQIVIVTGSRHWTDRQAIASALHQLSPGLVVHGGARGADFHADAWAAANSVPCLSIPAEWERMGKRAGVVRNLRMLDTFPGATVLGFPLEGGRGTQHCMRTANQRNMRLIDGRNMAVLNQGPRPAAPFPRPRCSMCGERPAHNPKGGPGSPDGRCLQCRTILQKLEGK